MRRRSSARRFSQDHLQYRRKKSFGVRWTIILDRERALKSNEMYFLVHSQGAGLTRACGAGRTGPAMAPVEGLRITRNQQPALKSTSSTLPGPLSELELKCSSEMATRAVLDRLPVRWAVPGRCVIC